jgi:hypothetical protein
VVAVSQSETSAEKLAAAQQLLASALVLLESVRSDLDSWVVSDTRNVLDAVTAARRLADAE